MTNTDTVVLDLSGTRPLDTYALPILFPGTTKPTGWSIVLAGPAHPQTLAVADEITREAIDKQDAIEFAQVNNRKWKTDAMSVDGRRRRNVTIICRRIISWSPNPTFKFVSPDPIEFSLEAAVDLFLRADMSQFFGQVAEYIASERAFTRPSETI